MYQAKLYIPAFTKGKKQLSANEVQDTRRIANVFCGKSYWIGHYLFICYQPSPVNQ